MKVHLTLLLLLFCCVVYCKQKDFKGKVLDNTTKEEIPYASITVLNANTIIDGTSTNEFGNFKLQLKKNATHIKITFIGYQELVIKIDEFVIQKKGLFYLLPTITVLNEIVVNAEQTTTSLKIDRKIINIGADLQQSGATALEAFDQVAEIQTDLGTGTLSLRGNGNVRLLINGKPSGLNATELLDQLPASSILRVEIITSPSAKNLADGLSGIINIILKKDSEKGLNLNSNGGFGTKRYNYGLDGNYSTNFVNFRWNLSQAGRKMDSKQNIFQKYTNGNTRDFFAPHDFNGLVKTINTGLDFFINKRNTLSIDVNYTDDFHSFYNNTFYTNVSDRSDYVYIRNSSHNHKTTNFTVNYRKVFSDENHYLEFDYQFSNNNNVLPAEDFEDAVFLFEEERINKNKLHALALDYALPLNDNVKLETGFSWNSRNLESTYYFNESQSKESLSTFIYDENLFGIYGLSTIKIKILSIQLGVRFEHLASNSKNFTSLETTHLTFSNFFPSIHASYKPDENNTINLGFSRRISRPNFRHINPFQARNQYFEWISNPNLQPEFSNNVETNYQFDKNKFNFSASLFYRYRTAVIERLQEIDSNGVLENRFDNIGEKHSYGIEVSVGYKVKPFWTSQLSANYYHTSLNQDVFVVWDELYSSNLIFKNTFKILKNLSADFTFRQNFKTQNTFSFIQPRNRIDVAVRLKLLENRLNLNVRIIDLLDNNLLFRETVTQNVVQNEKWRFQSQTFGYLFSVSYQLFQNKSKNRNRKNRDYQFGGTTD